MFSIWHDDCDSVSCKPRNNLGGCPARPPADPDRLEPDGPPQQTHPEKLGIGRSGYGDDEWDGEHASDGEHEDGPACNNGRVNEEEVESYYLEEGCVSVLKVYTRSSPWIWGRRLQRIGSDYVWIQLQ